MHIHCFQYATNKHTRNKFSPAGIKWQVHEECDRCCECQDARPEGETADVRQCVRCLTKAIADDTPASHIKIGGIYDVKFLLCMICQLALIDSIKDTLYGKGAPKPPEEKPPEEPAKKRNILLEG